MVIRHTCSCVAIWGMPSSCSASSCISTNYTPSTTPAAWTGKAHTTAPRPQHSLALANIWHPRSWCHAQLATHPMPQKDGSGLFKRVTRSYLDTPSCLQVPPPHPTQRRPPPPHPGLWPLSWLGNSVICRTVPTLHSSTPNSPNRALAPSVHSSPGGAMAREAGVSPQPRVGGCPLDRNALWVPHRPSGTGTLSGHAPERPISPRTGASSWQISYPAASQWSHHRPTAPTGLPRHHYEQYSGHSQKDTRTVEGDSRSVRSRPSQRQ